MSDYLQRHEKWTVQLRNQDGEPFDQEVNFVVYNGKYGDDLLVEDLGADAGYVVALYVDALLEDTEDLIISGIRVRKLPEDLEDPTYLAACWAITDGTAPAIYGWMYGQFTLERIRDGMNLRTEDPYAQL